MPRVALISMWGRDEAETLARLAAWNSEIQRVRARVEKIFATWKRSYGLRRMRWRGLARTRAQVHFTTTAYNLKRSLHLQPAQRLARLTRHSTPNQPPASKQPRTNHPRPGLITAQLPYLGGRYLSAARHGEAAERALAHAEANPVRGAYRGSDMLEQRRTLMAAWNRHCAGGRPSFCAKTPMQAVHAIVSLHLA